MVKIPYVLIWFKLERNNNFAVLFDHCKDFVLTHDDQFFAIDFDGIAAGILAKYDLVADFYSQCAQFTTIQDLAVAYGNNFALIRLLFGGTRQQDAACSSGFFFLATNDHAIVQRTDLHL